MQIFQANNQTHQIQANIFMNLTSLDTAILYPQFFYESLFKTTFNDPDFEFRLTTAAFPVFYVFREREESAQTYDYIFMLSIGLALIPCVIVSFILNEREKQLKH
jgi:hypothetical protein